MSTIIEARDNIFSLLNSVFSSAAVIAYSGGVAMEIEWPGVALEDTSQHSTSFWARVNLRNNDDSQRSYPNHEGNRRFENTGQLIIQLFAPTSDSSNYTKLLNIARELRAAIRVGIVDSDIMFLNATIIELDPIDNFSRINVSSFYSFDEIA